MRRPPRGVPRSEYAKRDFYDCWLPELAPSAALVGRALGEPWTPRSWQRFEKKYRSEMNRPEARHLLETLALLSKAADFSVGCYCEDEDRCHRSILRRLLQDAGARVV